MIPENMYEMPVLPYYTASQAAPSVQTHVSLSGVRETVMNATVNTKTRGLVQINRVSEKVWNCSIVFYGESSKLNSVNLDTKQVIGLLRSLGAPAPVSCKESHVVEFFNTPKWVDLKEFGFFVAE